MSFERYFRACSYAMVACGVLALAASGGVGAWLAAGFASVLVVSWRLAGTRWQLSERAGMYVVLLALPAFYLDWRFQRGWAEDAAGQVYANVWHQNRVARIDPQTGRVTGWIDLSGLLKPGDISEEEAVLNGIAYDESGDRLFVTGKLWPKLFEVKLRQK